MIKGIDVSKHQGTIDWGKVKAAGIQFAILRAGYGMFENQIDPTFENNYSECKRLGIPIGTYWYSYATSVFEAKKEAAVYLKILKGKDITLPNWFDQEYEPGIKALDKQLRTDICLSFMDEIKAAGYQTGLYCSYDWYMNWVDHTKLISYPVWIAQYGDECQYKGNNLAIWQHSATGRVDGIKGDVDLDISYQNYNQDSGGKWKKNETGWWFEYSDGSYPRNQWKMIENRWYWFNERGYCVKGYHTINGKNYYFAEQYAFDGKIRECQLIMTTENGDVK